MRVAAYYAPFPEDPLWQNAACWLGRDPETNETLAQPEIPLIQKVTAEPRLYGFHATLKPPFRLADGARWDDLLQAFIKLAAGFAPFELPSLAIADVHGFLALRETMPCPALQALADASVAHLDTFRAPPSEDELARRRRAGLTSQEEAGLARWGYPYVFGTWFFHMTLTRRLTAPEKQIFLPAAQRHFARAIAMPREVGDICLFAQSAPGEPFVIVRRFPLRD
ncbi:MAG: DUF1045 domain-containing protein [Acetobacteraceae bacterium]|nr:DUF1045 domain-containing protein [Acetobacteraceae bacterium]